MATIAIRNKANQINPVQFSGGSPMAMANQTTQKKATIDLKPHPIREPNLSTFQSGWFWACGFVWGSMVIGNTGF
jgi:hypothetical protein